MPRLLSIKYEVATRTWDWDLLALDSSPELQLLYVPVLSFAQKGVQRYQPAVWEALESTD